MTQIPRSEHPRPDFERAEWLNLNGEWQFKLYSLDADDEERAFDRQSYDRVITVPYSWAAPLSGVGEDAPGTGWYRREVEFEPGGGRLFLVVGACDHTAQVYVNGELVAEHAGGYTPFEADVTGVWRAGKNVIEVRARDEKRDTQLYGKQGYGGMQGIWQTVYLEKRPEAYIESLRAVTKISGDIEIFVRACAPDGEEVACEFGGARARAAISDGGARLAFKLDGARLWSPDDPYLYEGCVSLASGDNVRTYFGVREIETSNFGGRDYAWILLNKTPVYINATLDQAFNPKGYFTYPTDADIKAEAWRLKRLGLNAARIHIKCEEPRKLYWMDKLGVLIIADVPNFWGAPVAEAKAEYERAWTEYFKRDINHPCIFMWVMFNETWGLFTQTGENTREYLPETQKWVCDVYARAKAFDPTRIIEDNSACNYDHVDTDINTWHFYIHGYENVRAHIKNVVESSYPGSAFNCAPGYTLKNTPLMNSECGMVWGVEGSAGDSDLAWQYHYMLNEFRLYDKLCGFVFTEFHDVVNEFNGYYRIDDTDKDWGYEYFCRGMRVRDLHAGDFACLDFPPCLTLAAGARASVPVSLSSWTSAHHSSGLTLKWELWHDTAFGRVFDARGERAIAPFDWGVTPLKAIDVDMPLENAVAVLSVYLIDADGNTVSRNFTTFDVRAQAKRGEIEIPLETARAEGFKPVWFTQEGGKLNLGGAGEAAFDIKLPDNIKLNYLTLAFEASAKRVLSKDLGDVQKDDGADHGFMLGYRVDRGEFKNSCWMTDETQKRSQIKVKINGEIAREFTLENDPADARGVLSWLYQGEKRALDDAGAYGELKRVSVPSRLLPGIEAAGRFTLSIEADGGLTLYGRNSGLYPLGLTLIYE